MLKKFQKLLNTALLVTIFALFFLIVALYAIKFFRRWRWLIYNHPKLKLLFYYSSLADALSELGIVRKGGTTLEEFSEKLREKLPSLTQLVEIINKINSPNSPDVTVKEIRQSIERVRRELSRAFPLYRRLWGIVRPIAWTRHIAEEWSLAPPPVVVKFRSFTRKLDELIKRFIPSYQRG